MPQYFFHLYDDAVSLDDEGVDLPDVEAARHYAVISAREIACAEVMKGHLGLNHRIVVEDQTGRSVAAVIFRDVVKLDS